MAEAILVRRSAQAMYQWLTGELKYPLGEAIGRTMAIYKENCIYAPGGMVLTDFPLVIYNNGGPGRYWCGPMKFGMRDSLEKPVDHSVPDHSLENLVYGHRFKNKRCLVPATGFISRVLGKEGLWYTHYKDDRFFTMAAIYQECNGTAEFGFALANVYPNRGLMKLGINSMPAFLNTKEGYKWLRPGVKVEELSSLLRLTDDPELVQWPSRTSNPSASPSTRRLL
jgi:hypothetical protein